MAQSTLEIRMLKLDEIRPNPHQPREAFPKESIEELSTTIKNFGLLQPISVRKKGNTYQIISGERRWRAAQFAGLKEIPAIVKDVNDGQMMIEALIENVQRKDLESLEKARGLAEVYRLQGFEPRKVQLQLKMIERVVSGEVRRELSAEEDGIKEVADMVGLSYDYQYRLLSQLRLSPKEQKRVSELKLGYEKISSIATIKEPSVRGKLIEVAPDLKRAEVKQVSKIVKKTKSKPIVEAVLKPKSRVTPVVAEKILELPEEKQAEAVKQVETMRLEEDEAVFRVETLKQALEPPPPQEIERVQEGLKETKERIRSILETPEVKERGELFRNWLAHQALMEVVGSARCPICGKDGAHLVWKCHDLSIEDALAMVHKNYQKAIKGGERRL
ncbi:MAG: ParB/RepB/Spo0J family partition protein [Candidatus Bathyarchaeota archaeon]|jgi:ParB family chromosome partitioning protein